MDSSPFPSSPSRAPVDHEVRISEHDGAVVVEPTGVVDAVAADLIVTVVRSAATVGTREVVVDFGCVRELVVNGIELVRRCRDVADGITDVTFRAVTRQAQDTLLVAQRGTV